MKLLKAFFLIAVFAAPSAAHAGITWSTPKTNVTKAEATSGTESAPTLVTDGAPLAVVNGKMVGSFVVTAEASGAMTAGGTLRCYLWNPISEQWNRASELDITVTAEQDEAYSGFVVHGAYTGSRIAFIPNGVGLSVDIFIIAVPARR